MRRPQVIYAGAVTQFRVTAYHAPANDTPRRRASINDNDSPEAA